MTRQRLSIFVVDDDEALRRSLVLLLVALGHPVQAFPCGDAFLAAVDPHVPGCVVLDLRMAGRNGVEVFERLRAEHSPLVVVFLSGHGDIPTAVEQCRKGAFGWIEKPHTEALQRTVQSALEHAAARAVAKVRWDALSDREREVAPWVARGQQNKEIARLLVPACGHRVVEHHRANVYGKLGVSNAAELRGWMSEHGWLTGFRENSDVNDALGTRRQQEKPAQHIANETRTTKNPT
jgi:FixJ family two-component response regulator